MLYGKKINRIVIPIQIIKNNKKNELNPIILIFLLFYQSPLFSKSTTLDKFDSNNLSDYFSGIVAFENKDNFDIKNYKNDVLNFSVKPYCILIT